MSSYTYRLGADFVSGFGELILIPSFFSLLIALGYLCLAPSIHALQVVGAFLIGVGIGTLCVLLGQRLEEKGIRLALGETRIVRRA